MAESIQFPPNSTSTMDDDPEKRSITAQETDHEDNEVSNAGRNRNDGGGQVTREKMLTTLIICFCNLINFMDRYSLPGMFKILFSSRTRII